jgi:hypothetical protein
VAYIAVKLSLKKKLSSRRINLFPKTELVQTLSSLRFMPMFLQPPRRHTGAQLIQAVDFGPACPQPSRYIGGTKGILAMDEDCLYLNVFTPHVSIFLLNILLGSFGLTTVVVSWRIKSCIPYIV